jgi:hypothetical protein
MERCETRKSLISYVTVSRDVSWEYNILCDAEIIGKENNSFSV